MKFKVNFYESDGKLHMTNNATKRQISAWAKMWIKKGVGRYITIEKDE